MNKNSKSLIGVFVFFLIFFSFIIAGSESSFPVITFFVIFVAIISAVTNVAKNQQNRGPRRTISSDGHIVPKNEDLTCEQKYGHIHQNLPQQTNFIPDSGRYVVHEENDLKDRWIILNGKKISLKDAAKY